MKAPYEITFEDGSDEVIVKVSKRRFRELEERERMYTIADLVHILGTEIELDDRFEETETERIQRGLFNLAREFLDAYERETGERDNDITLFDVDMLRETEMDIRIKSGKGITQVWEKEKVE